MPIPTLSNRWLDRWFALILVFKGLDGTFELIGGAILLLLPHSVLRDAIASLDQLSFVVHHQALAHAVHSLGERISPGLQLYVAVYSLLHGVIKIGLVIALLSCRYALYPAAIVVLALFMVYQMYRIVTENSVAFDAILTVVDAVVIWLTILEYQRHRPGKSIAKASPNSL